MPVIEVTNLHKRYRDKVAVEDVSFTVERGEIFGILGPNGAGKTTTVECVDEPDFDVVGEAGDGDDAITRVAELQPDVVLMDLRMPKMDGVTAIRRLVQADRRLPILVLTTFDSDTDVLPAVEAGAVGYLLKDAPTTELLDSVRAAAEGKSVLSPPLLTRLIGQIRKPAPGTLSKRELDALKLVADGASNREAARKLFISEASIKTHLVHIYNKLGVRDRAGAVGEAYRRNLLG